MNVANQITVGRLGLSIVLFVLMAFLDDTVTPGPWLLFAGMTLFITIVVTDALDGYYARKLHQISDFGRIADPAVDKITVCGTLVFLAAAPWARPVLDPWMVAVILSREFVVNGLRSFLESKGISFGADWGGKAKMIQQCIAVPAVFFFKLIEQWCAGIDWAVSTTLWFAHVNVWIMVLLTVGTGVSYIHKGARLLRQQV